MIVNQRYFDLEASSQPGAFSAYDMEIFVPEIEKLKPGDIYLEIGVDRGRSLSVAKQVAKTGVKIYGVDSVLTPELESYLIDNPHLQFWLMESVPAAKRWKEGEISLLFIDGNHTYEYVSKDIASWYPLMKKSGVMFFHDYDISSPGVIQAVDEFVKKYNLSPQELNVRSSLLKIQL